MTESVKIGARTIPSVSTLSHPKASSCYRSYNNNLIIIITTTTQQTFD
jgi:hypothetical protein